MILGRREYNLWHKYIKKMLRIDVGAHGLACLFRPPSKWMHLIGWVRGDIKVCACYSVWFSCSLTSMD